MSPETMCPFSLRGTPAGGQSAGAWMLPVIWILEVPRSLESILICINSSKLAFDADTPEAIGSNTHGA